MMPGTETGSSSAGVVTPVASERRPPADDERLDEMAGNVSDGVTAPGPWDPGLQPERTLLAWRRTVAALTVGALVALRVLPPVLGGWAAVASGAGIVAGGALWVAAARRARAVDRAVRTPGHPLPDGALLFWVAAVTTAGASVAAVALAVGLRI